MVFLVLHHTQTYSLVQPPLKESVYMAGEVVKTPFLQILFILSAYLFFRKNSIEGGSQDWTFNEYLKKIKSRFWSLLVPYLIWGAVAIVYNHYVKHWAWPSGWQWLTWFWDVGEGHPVGKALWFVKSLIVFSLLSPLYYFVVKIFRHTTPLLIFALAAFKLPIDLPWFNVYLLAGAYLTLCDISLQRVSEVLNWKVCLMFYVVLKGISCAFGELPMFNWLLIISLLFGLIGLLCRLRIPSWIVATSSLVYFLHYYFTGVRNLLMTDAAKDSTVLAVVAWLVTTCIVLVLCIGTFHAMKRFTPRLLNLVTGGRG